jgi:hypothetical protein
LHHAKRETIAKKQKILNTPINKTKNTYKLIDSIFYDSLSIIKHFWQISRSIFDKSPSDISTCFQESSA